MTKKSKVSIVLTALAGVGIVATSLLAVKNSKTYDKEIEEAEYLKDKSMTDLDFEKLMEDQGITDPKDVEYLTKKERAVIFFKTCYPALITGAATEICMIFAQTLSISEIITLTGTCAALAYKLEDAKNYIRINHPEAYEEMINFVDSNAAKRHFEEKPLKKEETYDGRTRYYEPNTMQDIFMTGQDLIDLQHHIDAVMATEMGITLNEILYYIKEHFDKNVKVPSKLYSSWGLPDDRCPETYDFIRINTNDIFDVKDKDGDSYVARVIRFESWDDIPEDEST